MTALMGLFFRGVSFVIASLPRSWRLAIGDFVGFLWFDVLRIRRDVAIENLGIAFPERSYEDRTKMARASLHSMGRTIVEYTMFPFFTRAKADEIVEYEGMDNLQRAIDAKKGVIIVTLHLGNGDLAISAMSAQGLPMHLISKEFKSRWLNDLWFGMRKKIGTRFISAEKSSFDIIRALKRGEIVVFVLDQFMGPPIGVRVKFFGKETGTAAGCALLAARTQATVIPSFTYRLPDGRHRAVFGQPIETLDHRPTPENIAVMTQSYTDKIEAIVREHPEQWMWIHRRWKEFRE